jgi:hypothetical protein
VGGVAQEPGHVSDTALSTAPRLLRHALGATPPLAPTREAPAVVEMHQRWAQAHGAPEASGGVISRARRRAQHLSASLSSVLGEDHELIGHVIRATDLLATRCDELGVRLAALEAALDEVVGALGADLVSIRSALARADPPAAPERARRGGAPRRPADGPTARSGSGRGRGQSTPDKATDDD